MNTVQLITANNIIYHNETQLNSLLIMLIPSVNSFNCLYTNSNTIMKFVLELIINVHQLCTD